VSHGIPSVCLTVPVFQRRVRVRGPLSLTPADHRPHPLRCVRVPPAVRSPPASLPTCLCVSLRSALQDCSCGRGRRQPGKGGGRTRRRTTAGVEAEAQTERTGRTTLGHTPPCPVF
jgi:hypothetical protein